MKRTTTRATSTTRTAHILAPTVLTARVGWLCGTAVVACALFLCSQSVSAQPIPTPIALNKERVERERFAAAKIDSATVVEYAYKGANPEKTGRKDMLFTYDERGNKTLEARLNAKGEVDTKMTFRYNGTQCSEQQSFMQFETLSYTLKYSYDAAGALTEAVYEDQMSAKGGGRKLVYEYTPQQPAPALAQVKYVSSNGKVGYLDAYSYDASTPPAASKCVKVMRLRADESIEFKETWGYDVRGNLAMILRFGGMEFDEATAKLERKTMLTYDAEGNLLEEATFNGKNKLESKLVHTYSTIGGQKLLTQTVVWSGKKGAAPKPAVLRKYEFHTRP
jgi:hypothetical protein